MAEADLRVADDFDYLVQLLPIGWEEQAKTLGALRRCGQPGLGTGPYGFGGKTRPSKGAYAR
ncbi:MAG: hypothetical protein U9Q79_12480 [Candidatus Hydrogenedentes bacterium]|nr:hypothetical protein [Candidatus Hydrogenedentota bacterium]